MNRSNQGLSLNPQLLIPTVEPPGSLEMSGPDTHDIITPTRLYRQRIR